MKHKLLTWDEVHKLTNIDRSTAWRQEEKGIFPARIIVGFNAVRWDEKEIKAWLKLNNKGGVRGKKTCKTSKKTYQKKTTAAQGVVVVDMSRTLKIAER